MACSPCRKETGGCNNGRPACSNCVRLNLKCEYEESDRKRAPKRKAHVLEEHLVAYDRQTDGAIKNPNSAFFLAEVDAFAQYQAANAARYDTADDVTPDESESPQTPYSYNFADVFWSTQDDAPESPATSPISLAMTDNLELISRKESSTGFTESVKVELTELFFRDCYPNIPIIHKSRYYASLRLPPESQPPLCLRYAMWALAAVQTKKWNHLSTMCYDKARNYLERDEMRAAGTEVLNVAHVQCWSLIATYESYMLLSLRTWGSIRRAAALAQVLRLHSIDEPEEVPSHLLPEAQDPLEVEERRRAFWSAFSSDRWISSTTGYPMTIAETMITTRLPCSEDSFLTGSPEETQSLGDALEMGLDSKTSLFGARAVLACILGRVMRHVGSAASFDRLVSTQQFWSSHTKLDHILSKVSWSRSADLRPSSSSTDLKIWALDMWLHGLSICLHQTAIDCATKQKNSEQVEVSLKRCREAADHIIRSIRSIAHIQARKMDPYTASTVYMAATVLIQGRSNGNSRPADMEDLRFLQQVLEHMHKHWKVTEIFITQFNEDLLKYGIGLLETPRDEPGEPPRKRLEYFAPTDAGPSGGRVREERPSVS